MEVRLVYLEGQGELAAGVDVHFHGDAPRMFGEVRARAPTHSSDSEGTTMGERDSSSLMGGEWGFDRTGEAGPEPTDAHAVGDQAPMCGSVLKSVDLLAPRVALPSEATRCVGCWGDDEVGGLREVDTLW